MLSSYVQPYKHYPFQMSSWQLSWRSNFESAHIVTCKIIQRDINNLQLGELKFAFRFPKCTMVTIRSQDQNPQPWKRPNQEGKMSWNRLLPSRRIRALPYNCQFSIQKQRSFTMTVRDKTSNNSNKRSKKVGELP